MLLTDSPPPELLTLTPGRYDLVEYALAGAGSALLACTLYGWTSRTEVGVRYRPAVLAGLCVGAVATVSYLLLFLRWGAGYDLTAAGCVPTDQARLALSPRYVDRSVTVPLLTAELLAVCTVAGARARELRASAMTAPFLMILTGHPGPRVAGEGRATTALLLWGLISTVFYDHLYVALIGAVRSSMPAMGREAAVSLRNATIGLLDTFGVYPLVSAVPVFVDVTRCLADDDPAGLLGRRRAGQGRVRRPGARGREAAHRRGRRRGVDTHPEAVWVSNVERSRAVLPPVQPPATATGPTTPRA